MIENARPAIPWPLAIGSWQFAYCQGRSQQGWAKAYETGEWVDVRRRHPSWAHTTADAPGYPPDLYARMLSDAPLPDLRMVQMVLVQDRGRYAPDEVAIIDALHGRMVEERWYFARSHGGDRR